MKNNTLYVFKNIFCLILLCIALNDVFAQGNFRECDRLRRKDENYALGDGQKFSWCDFEKPTAYTSCMCQEGKKEDAFIADRKAAGEKLNNQLREIRDLRRLAEQKNNDGQYKEALDIIQNQVKPKISAFNPNILSGDNQKFHTAKKDEIKYADMTLKSIEMNMERKEPTTIKLSAPNKDKNYQSSSFNTNTPPVDEYEQKKRDWEQTQNDQWRKIEQQHRQNMEKAKRLEYHNKRNADVIANQIGGLFQNNININTINYASNPHDVIKKLNDIKYQTKQKKANIEQSFMTSLQLLQMNTPTTKQEANSNLTGLAVTTAAHTIAIAEAQKKQKEAEQLAKKQMDEFRDDLNNTYANAINSSLDQAVYSIDEKTENTAINQYFYLKCVKDKMNREFSYYDADWANPSTSCNEYEVPFTNSKSNYNNKNLDIAERKMLLYIKYNYEPFKNISMAYVNQEIKENPKNANSYLLRAKYSTDIITEYADIIYAQSLSNLSSNEQQNANKVSDKFSKLFYEAIKSEDINFLKRSLNLSLYPANENEWGTPIANAVRLNKKEAFRLLINANEKLDEETKKNLMLDAAKHDALDVLKTLQNYQVDFKSTSYKDVSPLEKAFYNNSKNVFAYLLKNGENHEKIKNKLQKKEAFDAKKAELLLYASLVNNDINLLENSFSTYQLPLKYYQQAVLENINHSGVKPIDKILKTLNTKDFIDSYGKSALHYAAINDDVEMFYMLIDNGFSTTLKDNYAKTPIDYVVESQKSSKEIVTDLRFSNIDLSLGNSNIPFLHNTFFADRNNFDNYLKSGQKSINQTGLYGWTLLHYAAREGDVKYVKILLEKGADKNIKDQWGRTPYHIANERKKSHIHTSNNVKNEDYKEVRKLLKEPLKVRLNELKPIDILKIF
jgi:ankyrin repeat protein